MTVELASVPSATLIEGGVSCGKTTALLEQVENLLRNGTSASDLLVLAASPDAARALRERVRALVASGTCEAEVSCPHEVARALIDCEAARAATGRTGRLVTPVEMGFIMEDMKTSGLKQRRLREMLKFFYRSWTELAGGIEGSEDWLLPGEEADVHRLLLDTLAFTGAVLEPELSVLALRFLHSDDEARAEAARPYVLVDDYQLLNRASQHLVNLLARDSIVVTADPAATAAAFESYPYGEGVSEFIQAHPHCEHRRLASPRCAPAAARAAALLHEEIAPEAALLAPVAAPEVAADASDDTRVAVIEAADPAAEMNAVAETVAAALEGGCDPSAIYVLAFHPAWTRSVVAALEEHGASACAPLTGQVAVGDYRDLDRCAPARLLTALALAADPADALAWRAWCGFGDYLANSAAFADMRAHGVSEDKSLVACLEEASAAAPAEGFPHTGIGRVIDAYRTGRKLVAAVRGLEGDALLDALAAELGLGAEEAKRAREIVGALAAPSADEGNSNSAAALTDRARRRMSAPVFENEAGHVLVGDTAHLTGRSPEVLILTGFVDGLFPSRDYFDATVTTPDKQKLMRTADLRRLYAAVGKAQRQLVVSGFTAADLVSAERLKLEISRVRLRHGKRVASTRLSTYCCDLKLQSTESARP